jgi:hypothetical protein
VRYGLAVMRLSALILACSFGVASFAQGFIFTFDTDSEGWQRGTNTDINFLTFDGPANWAAPGLLTGTDFANLATYFSPNMGGTDREALYNGIFAFDFRSKFIQNVDVPSVYMTNGTTTINASVPIVVTPDLVTKEITLNTTGGWRLGTATNGAAATEADIRAVLGSLTYVGISGEIRNGGDRTYLDNVRAEAVPEPGIMIALAGGAALLARRRKNRIS